MHTISFFETSVFHTNLIDILPRRYGLLNTPRPKFLPLALAAIRAGVYAISMRSIFSPRPFTFRYWPTVAATAV
jgi:hypothetical protein